MNAKTEKCLPVESERARAELTARPKRASDSRGGLAPGGLCSAEARIESGEQGVGLGL